MFGLDAFHLARIQFAFTVSFHIIFPAITIGLASYLAVLEGLWLKTKNPVWRALYHFWSKIFAVNFGMGVVSGLVMAYQFGTNWSGFSQFAGSITGPLLTYEVLTAFFLEAGFLGVMLFGWNKVGPGLHFLATCMVALGTLMSTFWIDLLDDEHVRLRTEKLMNFCKKPGMFAFLLFCFRKISCAALIQDGRLLSTGWFFYWSLLRIAPWNSVASRRAATDHILISSMFPVASPFWC